MNLNAMQEHSFNLAWKISGRKTLQLIGAVSKWTLPAGVTYNDRLDGFYNGSARVTANWDAWGEKTSARYIPAEYTRTVQETTPGIVEVNRAVTVTILGGSAVKDALVNVWGVVLGETLYRVSSVQAFPVGEAVPAFYNLTLTEDV